LRIKNSSRLSKRETEDVPTEYALLGYEDALIVAAAAEKHVEGKISKSIINNIKQVEWP
jgi:hypothetical protein